MIREAPGAHVSAATQTTSCPDASDESNRELLPIVEEDVDLAFLASQARRFASFQAGGQLTDVTITVGGQAFECHRLHLCAGSAFFRALFASSMRDAESARVEVGEMEAHTFASVLSYIYSGQCSLTPSNVVAVLAAADRLAVVELRERCTRFLQRNLTAENVVGAAAVATALLLTRLKESALRVALEQFEEVSAHESFVESSAEFLEQLLASDELRAREETVVSALARWHAHAPDERGLAAAQLLPLLRLPLCDVGFLQEEVEGSALARLPPGRELLLEAYAHHGCAPALHRLQQESLPPRSSAGRDWLRDGLRDVLELVSPRAAEGLRAAGGLKGTRSAPLAPESRRRRRVAAGAPDTAVQRASARAHLRTIKAVCVDEEAGLLYTGSWDHTAKKWGIRTGACLLTFTGHKQDVIGLHLSPSASLLFTCADRVRAWDVRDGSCVRVFGASTFYCAVSDSEGRALYAAQYDGQILHFALHGLVGASGTAGGGADATSAAGSGARAQPGALDTLAATGGAAGTAVGAGTGVMAGAGGMGGPDSAGGTAGAPGMEVRTAVRVLSGHESGVMGFDMRGDLLVSASIDSTAKAWSQATGECTRTFVGHTAQLRAVQLWRDTLITGSYDQTIRQWDLDTAAQLRVFQGHTDAIRAIVVGLDFMSCFMWSASSDGTVRKWDLETGAQVHRLSAHEESIFALAHADGVLYTGSADCTAKRFDVHTGRCIMTFPRKLESTPDGEATPPLPLPQPPQAPVAQT